MREILNGSRTRPKACIGIYPAPKGTSTNQCKLMKIRLAKEIRYLCMVFFEFNYSTCIQCNFIDAQESPQRICAYVYL